MTYENIVDQLINWPRFRKAPGFDTVKALMSAVGYKDTLPVIHVVGTNGKGSVASMVSSILACHGLKVGLFTSPHLVDIRERMTINGQWMTRTDFKDYYMKLSQAMAAHMSEGGERATFFEMMFLMALQYFSEEQVDVMVLEAGIGGLHDTTNVLENRWLNIITSIGLDHTAILGDTIEAITRDKAGIIRSGSRTVAWTGDEEVRRIIEGIVREKDGELVSVERFDGNILERRKDAIDFSLYTKYYRYERLTIHAVADYQLNNASMAITAVHELADRIKVKPELVSEGLGGFRWPGRMEYITPWLLVDGGHNLAGIRAFVDHLNSYESRTTDIMFVCMGDKDYNEMCQALLDIRHLGRIYVPKMPGLRPVSYEILSETFRHMGFYRVSEVDHLTNFLDKRKESGADTLLGAVGSLYLVGEIKMEGLGVKEDM